MDPTMEAANPMFGQGKDQLQRPISERESIPLAHRSTKSQKPIPENTTLNKEDWEMIEDSLLPFECTAILIALGGFAFIGLTIHAFVASAASVEVGIELLNGMNAVGYLYFVMVIPALVGSIQVLLAGFFGCLAALESWQHVSIQDVIAHHLPAKAETCAKRVPLTCTAMKAYLVCGWLFLLVQFITSAVFYGITATLDAQTNQGADAGESLGVIRDILDYSAAVFNVCCEREGWSKQGIIPQCAPGTTKLENCTVPAEYAQLSNRLCACYTASNELYARYETYLTESRACNVSRNAFISIPPGQKIPGTTISIRALIPPSVTRIPMVGNMAGSVYGCGTGFIRGFQWHIAQFATNEMGPYFLAMLIISALQIVFLIVGATLVCRIRIAPTRVMGEDGNWQYAETSVTDVKRGIRGLFFKHPNSPSPPVMTTRSPHIAFPGFRARTGSSGAKTPKIDGEDALALSIPTLDHKAAADAQISSPEMLKLAAKRTSASEDVSKLDLTKKETTGHYSAEGPKVEDIDSFL